MTAQKAKSNKNDAPQTSERRQSVWRKLWEVISAHRERKLFAFLLALMVCGFNFFFNGGNDIGRWKDVQQAEIEVVDNVKMPHEYYFQKTVPASVSVGISVLGDNRAQTEHLVIPARIILDRPLRCDDANDDGVCSHINTPHVTTKSLTVDDLVKSADIKIRGILTEEVDADSKHHELLKKETAVKIYWDEVDNKEVRVVPDYEVKNDPGENPKLATVSVQENAIIRGPKYLLNQIAEVNTEHLVITSLGKSERKVNVVLAADKNEDDVVHAVTPRVTAHISVVDSNAFEFRSLKNIRVHYLINQNDIGRLNVIPADDAAKDTVEVIVKVPVQQQHTLDAQDIIAYCDLTGFPQEDAKRKVPVKFILPPGIEIKDGEEPSPRRLKLQWNN